MNWGIQPGQASLSLITNEDNFYVSDFNIFRQYLRNSSSIILDFSFNYSEVL